jgi:ketosteroid isomerase-like protein
MRKVLLLCVLLLVVGSMLGVACAKSDSAQIEDVVNDFAAAWNAEDFDKCLTYLDLGTMSGYEDLVKASMAAEREASGKMTVEKVENIEIEDSTATADVTSKSASDSSSTTDAMSFKKIDDEWKISADSMM